MSQSTPLDQLPGMAPVESNTSGGATAAVPPADEERVRRILAEMNAESTVQASPGFSDLPRVITEPPVSTSTGEIRMDSTVARANIIGNSAPSMADFHAMFQQGAPGMAPIHGPAVIPASPNANQPTGKSKRDSLAQHLRAPLAVAVIVFFLNMPIITTILSRYASWMYLGSGEISVGGLIVKALLAGTLFAAYQGVTAFFG